MALFRFAAFSMLNRKARFARGCLSGVLLLATAIVADGVALAEEQARPIADSPPVHGAATTAAVVWRGSTMFPVTGLPPSLTAEERAAIIAGRLEKAFTASPGFSCAVREVEGALEVVCGGAAIVRVGEEDARAVNATPRALADDLAARISSAAAKERDSSSLSENIRGAVKALAVTALFLLILLGMHKGRRLLTARVQKYVEGARSAAAPALYRFLHPQRIAGTLPMLLKWAHVVITLVCVYFYLPLVLGFFPATKSYADSAIHVMIEPFSGIGKDLLAYTPNLLFLVALAIVTRFLLKLIRRVFMEIREGTLSFPGFYKDWAYPTYQIVRFLLLAFAVVLAFPYLPGAETEAFKAVSIFLGVLFSFGSSSAVANVVSGVMLTYMRAFHVGDRVKISDTVGDVLEKTLLVTRLRTIKNVDVSIPNSLILGSHIVNFSANPDRLILNTTVTIGYDAPWRKIHELLIAAAKKTPDILHTPEPFVFQTALSDFYVAYELNAYTNRPGHMANIYSELHQNIQDVFIEAGVEIMSGHYTYLRDGNEITIPKSERGEGYEAPLFRLDLGGAGKKGPKGAEE